MLKLPDNARLGTRYADVCFFEGKNAEAAAKELDKRYFQNARAEAGFVNADLTEEGIAALLSQIDEKSDDFCAEDLTEEELFSPVIRCYLTLLPRQNAESTNRSPHMEGGERRLLLRLIAAYFGEFSKTEELALCERVIQMKKSSFLQSAKDDHLAVLCHVARAVLKKRIDGGFQ
ncbi:MAG: hypothetical protein ACOYI3_04170 [Christensenellales bacterium]